ncbi:MAG: glycosyltransferase family 39 protein, partial [Acidobacteriota bacterium]
MTVTRVLGRLIGLAAIAAIGWSLVLILVGGVTMTLGPLRLSSNDPWRPLLIGVAMAALSVWISGFLGLRSDLRRAAALLTPARAALVLALATMLTSLAWNSWTASGPDSFAYLSEAALWRQGRLSAPAPLAADAPWPDAVETFAPFGYRAAPDRSASLVPVVAPGVPMLMAALQSIGGHTAAFLVTPLAGGMVVWLTFLIGRRVRSPMAGLTAAWLVATSPALLFMLMWPMTDVPAAACVALMSWWLLKRSPVPPTLALLAGLAGSAAILTRANTALVVAGAGAWLLVDAMSRAVARVGRGASVLRLCVFAIGLVPGVAITAWLNTRWYGSPLSSGYGAADQLFVLGRSLTNSGRYLRWIGETSPLALIGLVVLVLPLSRLWSGLGDRRSALFLTGVVATTCLPYLLYQSFVDWWYLRFLLPAFPAIFVAVALLFDVAYQRRGLARGVAVAVAIAAGVGGIRVADARGVFTVGREERRYVTVADLVNANTESTSVILTSAHSGTVRYYAGRETIRYDVLAPASLDRAIAWLSARGRHPYILLEDWEAPVFATHFAAASALSALPFAPAVAWQSARIPGWVWLYDPLRKNAATVIPSPT